ncbi:CBM96 family carbohydrate-binding protein [Pontiella sulfatireligans]|uniref:Anti-sigma-I factor RsgI6 n=1 Tax=Pontiella sulfatireligans TaxID=2750658 RepID=A0A6C2UV06_9BACT|nr:DNRLRE domain-containing protein [Pontiella sulfatireligans]VGO22947.1 Anti-sigma-I factor RsgI6 [Pontiella sulfatireligans]
MKTAIEKKLFWIGGVITLAAASAVAAPLTVDEINQIETDLGITMSASDKADLAAIVKPDVPDQFHIDAETRIDQHRKADLTLSILDPYGNPVPGADVDVMLRRKKFHFGGVMNLKRFAGVTAMGMSTNRYSELYLKFFDTAGLGNGLKAKLRAGNEPYLPGYFAWCEANDIRSRGHTLIWPGNPGSNHLPANIRSILDDLYATATTNGTEIIYDEQLKTDLDTACDDIVAEWAGLWPVYEWDVYNEPFGNHEIQEILGYDVMLKWFHSAQTNAVDPNCGLFINDNRMVSATSPSSYISRTDVYKGYIDYIMASNAPITGIGFQNRIKFEYGDPQLLHDRLDDFATYGLDMAGTEFHIITNSTFSPTPYRRAEMTEEIMTTYLSHPNTSGLNCWSYTSTDVAGGGPLVDENNGNVQLNGLVWYYLNRIKYITQESLTTDLNGQVSLRGFIGDYDIVVQNGPDTYNATLTLDSLGEQRTAFYLDTEARVDRFEAVADAHVYRRFPSTNYGSSTKLNMRKSSDGWGRQAYLKFNVSELTAPIASAKLFLYSETETNTVEALSVQYGNWTENSITWSNRPAVGALIGTAQAQSNSWLAIDVTSYITNNGTYTIALDETGNFPAQNITSREGINRPYLEIMPSPDTDADGTQNWVDTDDDGDLLPDAYETLHGFNPLLAGDGQADPDHDGDSSALEFALGQNPVLPPASATDNGFRIASAENGIELFLNERQNLAADGLAVVLDHSSNLVSWTTIDSFDFTSLGYTENGASSNVVTDAYGPIDQRSFELATPLTNGFFRVRIEQESGTSH